MAFLIHSNRLDGLDVLVLIFVALLLCMAPELRVALRVRPRPRRLIITETVAALPREDGTERDVTVAILRGQR